MPKHKPRRRKRREADSVLARPLYMRSTLHPLLLLFALLVAAPTRFEAQSEPATEALASADRAWAAGKYDDAFARYQTVLRTDSTSMRALFRVATVLGWRNDFDGSVSLFRAYLRLSPRDEEARVALARTLAWSGRYDQALAICDSVLEANPGQRDAALVGAQVLGWRGNLRGAIGRYQSWLSTHPNDAEAWIGMGQVWNWSGRPGQAREALQRALAVAPNNASARAQLDLTTFSLDPSLEPTLTSTNDSDDNRTITYAMAGGWAAPWNARLLGEAHYRVADLGTRRGTAATMRASSSWTPFDGQWTIRGELGAARLDATDATDSPGAPHVTHVDPIVSARLSGRLTHRLSLGAGVTRVAFDETAPLILAGIASTTIDADGDIGIRPRLSLGGSGGWTRLTGGSGPNTRVAASAALRWSARPFLSFAGLVRGFTYQHAAFDGYFAPKQYVLAEINSRFRLGGELGWAVESEVGLGNQTITAFDNSRSGRLAERATATVLYRLAPGVEWGVSGGFANVASPTTISSADYRSYSVALKGRMRL